MKVIIIKIENQGNYQEEFILLAIKGDCNIGNFIVADTTYNQDDTISNKLRNIFWIPDKEVMKGDFVRIFTRTGIDSENNNEGGTITHTFFWNLKKAVWNEEGDCAVLFDIKEWNYEYV